jgi:hypothetical protein
MNLDSIVSTLADYTVVLEPDRDEPEWWAGAPSVARGADGTFYLAARMRHGDSPKGKRGYEIRFLRSDDGQRFEPIHRITREDAGVTGFERPALVVDPESGLYRLYNCTNRGRGWEILRFDDAADPAQFDGGTARTVLAAAYQDDDTIHVTGHKDPVLLHTEGKWHLFTIGIDRVERVHHFFSDDGEQWAAAGPQPVMENDGWHNLYTRPACVVPMAVGYLFVYEGSNVHWHDPNYNIATGLAYTPDLETFVDLTPDEPLLVSTTPGTAQTWRYSHWLPVGDELYVYWEAARPNGTNEIRMARVPRTDV